MVEGTPGKFRTHELTSESPTRPVDPLDRPGRAQVQKFSWSSDAGRRQRRKRKGSIIPTYQDVGERAAAVLTATL